jgi:hypothetical protein
MVPLVQTFQEIEPLKRCQSLFMVIALFCLLITAGTGNLSAQTNHYESLLIQEKILNDFHILVDTWTEELYFEMYQLGDMRSKGVLSQAEFAQRMVDLQWKPTLNPLKNEKVTIVYRNFASIQFDQQFENKVNQTQKIWKRMVFSSVLENKTWKFDLKQLINIPYEGQITDPIAEEKRVEKARAEAKAEKKKQQEQAAKAEAEQADQAQQPGQAGQPAAAQP